MADHDLITRGGFVVDGAGGEPFVADVAISGDRITHVGTVRGKGQREIDARGRYVTPGFVDIHTHYDGQITWESTLSPSSGHGVTTVVMGNCGVGFAPIRQHQRKIAIKLMEGVEDVPEPVLDVGLPWNWETFPEYLDALDQRQADIDFATQLPHSCLRVYVMGERGAEREPPTDEDLAEMRRLTREAIDAGALGVSTSRTIAHRFRDGRLAPSVISEEPELMALAAGLRDAGKGVFQIVPGNELSTTEEFGLIRRLAAACERPLSFTLIATDMFKGGWRHLLDGVLTAHAEGLPIRGQYYPRPVGIMLGLNLSYNMFSVKPGYRAIADLPLAEKVRTLRDPDLRARLIVEEPDDPNPVMCDLVAKTEALFVLGDPPNYTPRAEDSIAARAARMGVDPRELVYDELLKNDGNAVLYRALGNNEAGRYDIAGEMFNLPNMIMGLGDGGAHYGTICDGAYPTFLLKRYVLSPGESYQIPVQRAVEILSRIPAEGVGLLDRGLLRPGYKADVNVIDLDRLHLHAPRVKRDLPNGGSRLTQQADGYVATIVAGTITYENGEATGTLPGRLVRFAQPAPVPVAA